MGTALDLLNGPWDSQFAELVSGARDSLLLAAPYITRQVTSRVTRCLTPNPFAAAPNILILTNVKVESVLSGSLELEGIAELGRTFRDVSVVHIPSLHAKVFVADLKSAIITSGNLTDGGLRRNCEYGVRIQNPQLVKTIRRDFEGLAGLGAPLSMAEIQELAEDLRPLRAVFQAKSRQIVKGLTSPIKKKLKDAEDRVLQFRGQANTTQGMFRKTILYLLAKSPLRTSELHPLVQKIHPDLCDDSVDRIIGGMNFGKKWKHHVRSAQQALKREGMVLFDGEKWRLSGS